MERKLLESTGRNSYIRMRVLNKLSFFNLESLLHFLDLLADELGVAHVLHLQILDLAILLPHEVLECGNGLSRINVNLLMLIDEFGEEAKCEGQTATGSSVGTPHGNTGHCHQNAHKNQ